MPRLAIVKPERCRAGKDCPYICVADCPVNRARKPCVTVLETTKKPAIDEGLCIGCNICVMRCPYGALDIIKLPEELKEAPVHSWGQNAFRLYSLPIPQPGKVLGLLGPNAIGKSTALAILAGRVIPTLEMGRPATPAELAARFKGGPLAAHFKALAAKELVVAYKPQAIEPPAELMKLKVGELLRAVDERGAFATVVAALGLAEILDRTLDQLAGGELQRVAIAATSLKDATLYFFDEPSSYLDVAQRLTVATFLRELLERNRAAVLLAEHDLLVMDYVADLAQIVYGKPDGYGIAALPKSARAAINDYLEGWIAELKLRFREKPIRFAARAPPELAQKPQLTAWDAFELRLGEFSLSVEPGQIGVGEVVGVLGPNGIGKTSFARALAGLIEPAKGKPGLTVKVAYKPQYLIFEEDLPVAKVLGEALVAFEQSLIRPLELKNLLNRKLSELSGGQLQRVAIAAALAKDVPLCVLDEPSAFLDVEQRLVLAKTIKELTESRGSATLVIDHDILFIDNIAERLMVFEGRAAIEGRARGPMAMLEGMNTFLAGMGLTMRRDIESKRPRINKPGSRLDLEQKAAGSYYYE